ncbi:hypothetical protein WSM22_40010 [Cytophagales bacterium WSM2-2]|nr:hypothetical protein WSM22_40010 [Cytophagales bacterium WSM2-2]
MKVKLSPAQKIKLANSNDVFRIMREVLLREHRIDRSKAHFWVVCLAENHKLLLVELVSFGNKVTAVEPTDVFGFALQKKAAKMVMVHNRPDELGVPDPSASDKQLTDRMAAIGKFVSVPVIDHLIITEDTYYSFADTGLLKEIIAKSSYDLTFEQIDKLKEQMAENKRKADERLEKTIQLIAKKLLKQGLTIDQIVSSTGLERREVEKLKK